MKSSTPLAQARVVLSFDFDGTLHDPASAPTVPERFFSKILELRESHAAAWGVNTGRSLEHLLEGLEESGFPFLPDWVVAREREIHLPTVNGAWLPHAEWNQRCDREIADLFNCHQLLLDRIRHDVEQQTGAQWLAMEGEPAGVIAKTEEEIEWIVSRVLEYVDPNSDLSWQRNSIYLRFGHRRYQKGSSLAEVARLLGVGADCCFAIGDSHNDLEMLDPQHAGMTACPANALEEIQRQVERGGGLVTLSAHGAGVLEALDHYFGSDPG